MSFRSVWVIEFEAMRKGFAYESEKVFATKEEALQEFGKMKNWRSMIQMNVYPRTYWSAFPNEQPCMKQGARIAHYNRQYELMH